MNSPTRSNFSWALFLLMLLIGACGALTALALLGQQGEIAIWGIITAISLGTFFFSWTCALILFLRWRDRRSLSTPVTTNEREALRGTVYGLVKGAEYQVMQDFKDCYQNEFRRGERLHFKERQFLPYHGGHTLIFEERQVYLQEDANEIILSNFSDYIALVERREAN